MFKKVLIAEDHEVRNLGIINALGDLDIQNFEFVSYCDDALFKIEKAIMEGRPYDLLITDLSFEADHREQKLTKGQELVQAVKNLQPNIKVIVFSIEKKPKIIDDLFKLYQIEGFVSKGRNDGKDLKTTIRKVFANETVIPQEILNSIRNQSVEFTTYDVTLLELLSKGFKQQEMEDYLKENHLKPSSQSAVEKRLSELRELLGAKNNIEMVVLCKDLGII